jgi:Ran GTPase-activating protein (RanGAP) involved in mRNA processing and transport
MRRPQLKKLSIPYNGIEQEYCTYFSHVLNFDTLQDLDLSCNWFGMKGLERFKSSFTKFKSLKRLVLSNNKLCVEKDADTRHFRDVLLAVKDSLQELKIGENGIDDSDMIDFLIPAFTQMK